MFAILVGFDSPFIFVRSGVLVRLIMPVSLVCFFNLRERMTKTSVLFCLPLIIFDLSTQHQALKADLIARRFEGRVIMCDTHEPPERPDASHKSDGGSASHDSEDNKELEDEEERAASLVKSAKAVGPR